MDDVPMTGAQLYESGSLRSQDDGFRLRLRLPPMRATLLRVVRLQVDHQEVPVEAVTLELDAGHVLAASEVTPEHPAVLPPLQAAWLAARARSLEAGEHVVELELDVLPFGRVLVLARDRVSTAAPPAEVLPVDGPDRGELVEASATTPSPGPPSGPAPGPPLEPPHVPYDKDPARDYTPEMAAERQRYVQRTTGVTPHHITHFSFDPAVARGNVENFTGVAQVPLGFAGPLRVNGEHARGDFLIPLATSEGTLVASYNRGMKALNLAGGVTCTVSEDAMQRAPVFIFDSARAARDFRDWVQEHLSDLRREAEATSHVARLTGIESYLASRFAFLRFDYTTGDAAGQNMVGRATFAACQWILQHAPGVRRFYLESNLATDKKVSQVNVLRTRGKRVTAEATVPRRVLRDVLRVEPESLVYHGAVANVGAFMSGATSNGLHPPNAITAMFIATGQDVANVTEGSASVIHAELTPAGELYLSTTLPSLIVATHGGGTGLPTQRECLEILGCYGEGKVNKLAEIVAGVVLAGELSLAAAISSLDWVSSHERMGRHR